VVGREGSNPSRPTTLLKKYLIKQKSQGF